MKIWLDPYILRDITIPRSLNFRIVDEVEFFQAKNGKGRDNGDYTVTWGYPSKQRRFGVMETGFFWDAAHIDTIGLYQHSSLNTLAAYKMIRKFTPPADVIELIRQAPLPKSKYPQPNNGTKWGGVVFAAQNPGDRSVHSVSSSAEWWRLYETACKYYGNKLFVKLHPWNSGKTEKRMRQIAEKYGCSAGKCGHSIIKKCEHVVLCCSSFAVDCLAAEVPVKQLMPGYFYQTDAVTYTAGDVRKPVKTHKEKLEHARRLVNFLAWRYCFTMVYSLDWWKNLLRMFAGSRELFPLLRKYSYAAWLQEVIKTGKRKPI